MKRQPQDPSRPPSDRKAGDRALILPLVGCLLLLPPLAGIFQLDVRLLGIPFTGFYLFTVWAALIVGAALLARRIQRSADWNNPQPQPSTRDDAADKPD